MIPAVLSSALTSAFGGNSSGEARPESYGGDTVSVNVSAAPSPLTYLGNIRNVFGGSPKNGGIDFDRESRLNNQALYNANSPSIVTKTDITPYVIIGGFLTIGILIWKFV